MNFNRIRSNIENEMRNLQLFQWCFSINCNTYCLDQWWATIFTQGPLMQKFSFLRAAPLFFGKYKVKKVSFKIYSEAYIFRLVPLQGVSKVLQQTKSSHYSCKHNLTITVQFHICDLLFYSEHPNHCHFLIPIVFGQFHWLCFYHFKIKFLKSAVSS